MELLLSFRALLFVCCYSWFRLDRYVCLHSAEDMYPVFKVRHCPSDVPQSDAQFLEYDSPDSSCLIRLSVGRNHSLEIGLSDLEGFDSCPDLIPSSDPLDWNLAVGKSSGCRCLLLKSVDGWYGYQTNTTVLALDQVLKAGQKVLISKSGNVELFYSDGNPSANRSWKLLLRYQPKIVQISPRHRLEGQESSPWFNSGGGYARAGRIYTYEFVYENHLLERDFTWVLVTFDDLDLAPGDNVQINTLKLYGTQRKPIWIRLDANGTRMKININFKNRQRWSENIGWKFTFKFLTTRPKYLPRTKTTFIDFSSGASAGQRLSYKMRRYAIDHLYILKSPPGLHIAIDVKLFTEITDGKVSLDIRDGRDSDATRLVHATTERDLQNQPMNGYVTSGWGAYIRVRSRPTHFRTIRIISIIVTPFTKADNSTRMPSQCCRYPDDVNTKGGFLCSRSMRCIPANSACDGIDNCGDREDEEEVTCRDKHWEHSGLSISEACRQGSLTVPCSSGYWVRNAHDCFISPTNTILMIVIGVVTGCTSIAILVLLSVRTYLRQERRRKGIK